MNRMRVSAVIFCIMLVTILFNYIYVRSVRQDMLQQIDAMCQSNDHLAFPDHLEQTWKNRKRLLSLSVPLTVLDQIDIQLSIAKSCTISQDSSGYLSACSHLRELISSLDG